MSVLVVSADRELLRSVHDVLTPHGIGVCEASSAEQAHEIFQTQRPLLLLVDAKLAQGGGFRVCERVRQDPRGAHVPVLVVVDARDENGIRRASDAGATDFITRPLNHVLLQHRLLGQLDQAKTLAALRKDRTQLEEAQRIAKLGFWEARFGALGIQASSEFCRTYSLPGGESISPRRLLRCVHPDDRRRVLEVMRGALRDHQPFALEHRVVAPNRMSRTVHIQGEISLDDFGRPIGFFGTARDITAQKLSEGQIRYLAYHDALTGLGNRLWFTDRFRDALEQARRHERRVGLLFIDLDRFKQINDIYGQSGGDRILGAVAKRMVQLVRNTDRVARHAPDWKGAVVSRLGGDEFTVLLTDLSKPSDAAFVARRILDAIARPIALQEQATFMTASIGITVFPEDGIEVEAILQNAAAAMYVAKQNGGNGYQFYTHSLNAVAQRRVALESKLRQATSANEFQLAYQPKIHIATGRLIGAEALLRWQNPELGSVSPKDFIPILEDTGLIVRVGEWVLRTACEQSMAWRAQGLDPGPVSVNLSARQFEDDGLIGMVSRALETTGLSGDQLELEITETTLMQNQEMAISVLRTFKNMGIRISLDDFGTGYSSLSYLKRFPVDVLKIDGSFVRDLPGDADDAAIITAIISIAKAMSLTVIAEGVETEAQQDFLRAQGCDEVQGFLWSPPQTPESFTMWLQRRQTTPKTPSKPSSPAINDPSRPR